MSAILVPALYAMSGVCAFAALHHGLAVLRRRVNRIHLLFALLSLLVMALILSRAGAYQADTVQTLVAMRRWEIVFISLFFSLFPWFVANYAGIRSPKLPAAMTVFWILIFTVNLILPYGIQFVDFPRLTYFNLPWGESVVDLRVRQPGAWHTLGWAGIFVVAMYSMHACIALYRQGQPQKARTLAWAMSLFFGCLLFNVAVNYEIIEFIHMSDFGFIGLLVVMDLEMMMESRDQKQRMRAVLNHLPVAICLKDPQGRYHLINRKFEMFFHINDADIVGKNDFDLFPQEQAEVLRANERLALETRQDIESKDVLECNGKLRIFQSTKFPLLRHDNVVYAVGGVYIDITESRQKDDALDRLHRQVRRVDRVVSTSAIASSLAHELSQPLSAILSNAQAGLRFLMRNEIDINEIRAILQDIVRDDKRAGAVISGLRAMLQQQEIPRDDIDLAQCLKEVIELLHSELLEHGVEIEHLPETNLTVQVNKTQIQQVVLNLILNALEAMAGQPADKKILRVNARHADGKALVSIRDSGTGIAAEMLDRVFDGFYTTKPQGLGVGLEVCRSIMESHGGTIWAEINPDRGVTFHFTIPLAIEMHAEARAAEGFARCVADNATHAGS